MLFSAPIIETVADFLDGHRVPLVVDPVMVAASGAQLLRDDAVSVLVERLLPLATVVTPNLHEACVLAGVPYSLSANREELAERDPRRSAPARSSSPAGTATRRWTGSSTASATCRSRSSATGRRRRTARAARTRRRLAALLARGESLEDAARGAAEIATEAVRAGYSIGAGSGPVDVLDLASVRAR